MSTTRHDATMHDATMHDATMHDASAAAGVPHPAGHAGDDGAGDGDGSGGSDFWDRTWPVVRWSTVGVFALCGVGGSLAVDGRAFDGRPLLLGAAMAAVLLLASVRVRDPTSVPGYPWNVIGVLAVLYVLFALGASLSAVFFFAVFPLFWITWSALELRHAIPTALALTAVLGWMQLQVGDSLADAVVSGAVSFGFGLLVAIFIRRTIDEGVQRNQLIAELQAAQGRLAAVERDAGALAERSRLAHEIHDTLAQGFTSIVMLSQAAQGSLGAGDDAGATGQLRSIERTARENLAEARQLVAALTPPSLAGSTVADAIGRHVHAVAHDHGVDASFRVAGEPRPLPSSVEVVLLRVAQEAMANVCRHAAATAVDVLLSYGPEAVRLEVRDDGVGFRPGSTPAAGYGLAGMRARAEDVGGGLSVVSVPGQGTTVVAVVP